MLQARLVQQDLLSKLSLSGPIDDQAGPILGALLPQFKKCVLIDFSGVEYFNSLGIRTWVNFLRILLDGRTVSYEHCPMEFIQQICMIPNLSRGVEVKSFFADFDCKSCGNEQKIGFTCNVGKQTLIEQIEKQDCESCGALLELEDDIDGFLIFLDG